MVRFQHPHATQEHRHLRSTQLQQGRPIDEQMLRWSRVSVAKVVAEAVRGGLEHRERFYIGLVLRCVGTTRRKGNLNVVSSVLRGALNRGAAAEHDQVRERNHLLSTGL